MKRVLILVALAIVVGVISSTPDPAHATGDTGWSCPAGTTYVHKYEPLDGKTWTVPTPPSGWYVLGASLKVGGPGGGSHIDFAPVTPGQVLDVSYQQYDISHAHLCKTQTPPTTTTTSTSTTTTTEVPPSTTTTTTSARYHLDVDEFDLHRPQRKHVYDIDEPCDDDDCTREHVHVLTVDDLHNIVRAAYDWASHHWSAGPLHDEPDYDAILAAAHRGASVDDPA